MTQDEDPRLLEVAKLTDPVLAPVRALEIEQLARAQFVKRGTAPEASAPWREGIVANVLLAAVLCVTTMAYLGWTAQTLSGLRPLQYELTRHARTR
jgi:hypothetical protein